MKLIVNGKARNCGCDARIEAVLKVCGVQPDRVALLLNGDVLPRAAWPARRLREHDRLDILTLAGGG